MSRAVARVPRPTTAQQERRRDWVVKLTHDGYAADQIAAALDIALATVTGDRNLRRNELPPRRNIPKDQRLPDPAPVDWWSDPPPAPAPPPHVAVSIIPRIRGLLDYLKESNARNKFAFNLAAAEEAGDEEYLISAQVAIADAVAYLTDLQRIAQDKRAAAAARRPEARDDLRVPSTVPQVPDRSERQSLSQAKRLPPKGAGVIPGRIYAYLWAHYWAGNDLDDEAILAKIASREGNPNIKRIRAAAAEMKAALGVE